MKSGQSAQGDWRFLLEGAASSLLMNLPFLIDEDCMKTMTMSTLLYPFQKYRVQLRFLQKIGRQMGGRRKEGREKRQ